MQLLSVEKVREAMSMRLRLILALSFVLAWLPTLGHALGLGEIKLKSGLNQPMVAEIELLQMRDLGPNEVLPSLASQEDFERAGVSRDFFLTDMRFEVQVRPDGTAFVLVTTRKPVREPFVNFLMEVLWPAGRLLREYTLLMDPPVYADKVAEAVNTPALQQIPEPSIAPAPEPLPRLTRPEVQDPVTTVRSTQAPVAQPPRPTVRPTTPPPPPRVDQQPVPRPVAPPPPSYADGVEETYTTKSNDALWNIATLWRPSQDVTVQQTMLAIQRKNPEAFANNNINELKKGEVLRAPNAEEVRELSRQEAVAQVAEQERRWRQRLASRSGSASEDVEEAVLSDREVSRTYAPESGEQGGRITLASGNESATGESGASGEGSGGGNQKLAGLELENELDRITSEKLEAESRISELDALLTQNDSIISLQNEQIARLRERLKELERQSNPGQAVDSPVQQGVPGGDQAGEGLKPDLAGTPIGPASPPLDSPVNTQDSPVPTIKEPTNARRPVETPEAQAFYENPIYIGIAVGAVVVAGLVFFIFRRRDDDDEFDLLDDEDLEGFDEEDDDLLSAENEVPLSEINDDDATMVGALDSQIGDPSDVISEADIFMAYGRFPEAVKLLQSAIDSDPNHPEVYLKLLEVFVETKDGEGFVACEGQLQQMPFYGEVADRVNQLRQEYGGELPMAPAPSAEPAMSADFAPDIADEPDMDLGLSKSELEDSLAALDDDILEEPKQAIADEDFGLSPVETPEMNDFQGESDLQSLADLESSLTADFSQTPGLDSMGEDELDLGLDDVHDETTVVAPAAAVSEDLSFDEPVDFDPSSLAADLDDALGIDEHLGDGSEAGLPTSDVDFSAPNTDGPDGGDLADLAADLDLAFDEAPDPVAPTAPAANVPDNDFMADADEAATKLDLARAYIDMGDRAGARDILDEVVQEGNAEQKEEAKALLKKVG